MPSQPLAFSLLLVDLPARRHKLGCLCLSALISSRASAPRLADFDPRPTGGRAGGRAPAAPDGRAGACGARSTERLRRSLTARLRRDGLIPKKKTYLWSCFTLPLHLPSAYEASSARHGCASLTLARKTEVAQFLKHFWVLLLNDAPKTAILSRSRQHRASTSSQPANQPASLQAGRPATKPASQPDRQTAGQPVNLPNRQPACQTLSQ